MAASKPWWASLESRMFTIYKNRMESEFSSKFPNLYCTSSPMTQSASRFPTAYFRMADWTETGNDLENSETNAIHATVQIDVVSNTSLTDCKEVIYKTINIMKSFRFNIIGMPVYTANNNLYTGIVRCRRIIGNGEDIV